MAYCLPSFQQFVDSLGLIDGGIQSLSQVLGLEDPDDAIAENLRKKLNLICDTMFPLVLSSLFEVTAFGGLVNLLIRRHCPRRCTRSSWINELPISSTKRS